MLLNFLAELQRKPSSKLTSAAQTAGTAIQNVATAVHTAATSAGKRACMSFFHLGSDILLKITCTVQGPPGPVAVPEPHQFDAVNAVSCPCQLILSRVALELDQHAHCRHSFQIFRQTTLGLSSHISLWRKPGRGSSRKACAAICKREHISDSCSRLHSHSSGCHCFTIMSTPGRKALLTRLQGWRGHENHGYFHHVSSQVLRL